MLQSFGIRPATRDDASSIADLMVRGDWLDAIMTGFYEDLRSRVERNLALYLGKPDHVCLVAEENQRLVTGYISGTIVEMASSAMPALIVTEIFSAPFALSCDVEVGLLRALEVEAKRKGAMIVTRLLGPTEEEVREVKGKDRSVG